jgi:hypothetical protein
VQIALLNSTHISRLLEMGPQNRPQLASAAPGHRVGMSILSSREALLYWFVCTISVACHCSTACLCRMILGGGRENSSLVIPSSAITGPFIRWRCSEPGTKLHLHSFSRILTGPLSCSDNPQLHVE